MLSELYFADGDNAGKCESAFGRYDESERRNVDSNSDELSKKGFGRDVAEKSRKLTGFGRTSRDWNSED